MKEGESEEEYVERLRKELEDKFEELGPDTVIGCEYQDLLSYLPARMHTNSENNSRSEN